MTLSLEKPKEFQNDNDDDDGTDNIEYGVHGMVSYGDWRVAMLGIAASLVMTGRWNGKASRVRD